MEGIFSIFQILLQNFFVVVRIKDTKLEFQTERYTMRHLRCATSLAKLEPLANQRRLG
jgi:hypothetical protein